MYLEEVTSTTRSKGPSPTLSFTFSSLYFFVTIFDTKNRLHQSTQAKEQCIVIVNVCVCTKSLGRHDAQMKWRGMSSFSVLALTEPRN
jgi:hypothetical protein